MAKAKKAKSAKSAKTATRSKSAKSAKAAKSAKSAKKAKGASKAKAAKKGGGRRPNAAFMAAMTPSTELAQVVGSKPLPRTEVTKKLWAYIKKNNLQDQKNKRMIKADDALRPVFGGRSTVNMFEMTKLVNNHLR